ncbi:methyltransferase [Candidatus Woesearchaeota archaeon]|nr:methyltransferase [Candidatus Woesearchaeota archaeon]
MIRKKQIAIFLSTLKSFDEPKVHLEQYPSDSEEITNILWEAHLYGDLHEKVILDPGCGTGIIGIGALLFGAKKVIFLEKDPDALETLKENLVELEGFTEEEYNYEIIQKDYLSYEPSEQIDTIIMNPPFGTRDKHIDANFLKQSFPIASNIYSLHKSITEDYIMKLIEDNNFEIFYKYDFDYPLKNTYEHHTRKLKRIKSVCFGMNKIEKL